MDTKIALAGNPNCGKTTVFNALTGSRQFVGNWPGVTVEKKEGRFKGESDIIITDLPGIYSLSPYTPEETVARKVLIDERPDAVLNIIDGTNLERSLYLTLQLAETGLPVVAAINMIDVMEKNGDRVDFDAMSELLGMKVAGISGVSGENLESVLLSAKNAAKAPTPKKTFFFDKAVEDVLEIIGEKISGAVPNELLRWYSVKIFERDSAAAKKAGLPNSIFAETEPLIKAVEEKMGDDSESIIIDARYKAAEAIVKACLKKGVKSAVSLRIDAVVTNRWLAIPIFAALMFCMYYISVSVVGNRTSDWAQNGVFGEGWHLFGIGGKEYASAAAEYYMQNVWTDSFICAISQKNAEGAAGADIILKAVKERNPDAFSKALASYGDSTGLFCPELEKAKAAAASAPKPSDFGIWIDGAQTAADRALKALKCSGWLSGLILEGIIPGVGTVLSFVPQMFLLFLFLAFLESCGYMSRAAFIMDGIMRKFGLSGKSFIPYLIGTGCSVPAVMSTRTIENRSDRAVTVITASFIPCSAKLPMIAMISSALFGGAWWVAPSAYFVGAAAAAASGVILKSLPMFPDEPEAFIMELPDYRMPELSGLLRSVMQRCGSFVKKAATVIFLSSAAVWILSHAGLNSSGIILSEKMPLEASILGAVGGFAAHIFSPLGFGSAKAALASIMGLVAKEEIVSVLGVLDFEGMTRLSAYSFLIFNLLCAPCVAAVSAIRREMNSLAKTILVVSYQCIFAYSVSLTVYQLGSLILNGRYFYAVLAASTAAAAGAAILTMNRKYSARCKTAAEKQMIPFYM